MWRGLMQPKITDIVLTAGPVAVHLADKERRALDSKKTNPFHQYCMRILAIELKIIRWNSVITITDNQM